MVSSKSGFGREFGSWQNLESVPILQPLGVVALQAQTCNLVIA